MEDVEVEIKVATMEIAPKRKQKRHYEEVTEPWCIKGEESHQQVVRQQRIIGNNCANKGDEMIRGTIIKEIVTNKAKSVALLSENFKINNTRECVELGMELNPRTCF